MRKYRLRRVWSRVEPVWKGVRKGRGFNYKVIREVQCHQRLVAHAEHGQHVSSQVVDLIAREVQVLQRARVREGLRDRRYALVSQRALAQERAAGVVRSMARRSTGRPRSH